METENKIPRRSRLDLNTPAELAITKAIDEVEKVGADERLTDAITLLGKAKDCVSDYVDGSEKPLYNLTVQEYIKLNSQNGRIDIRHLPTILKLDKIQFIEPELRKTLLILGKEDFDRCYDKFAKEHYSK